MPEVTGRRVKLSPPRAWVGDLMHACRGVPLVSFERSMDVSAVAAARAKVPARPAWSLLLAKAFGIASAARPDLRRAYVGFPRPHLYEADYPIASVAVEREYAGEPAVFFALIAAPERVSLVELAGRLHRWKTAPVETIRTFQRLTRLAKWPRPVRRLAWRYAMDASGARRARVFGTFGVSTTGGYGATGLTLLSPLAATLNTGPLSADGRLPVRLHFDHRVLDGGPAARALADVEAALRGPILSELRQMADTRGAGVKAVRVVD